MQPKILKEMPKRYPTNGTFELTVRCNLHCKMCLFRHDDSENADLIKNEMTADEWIDMARQVAEAGTMNLLITGGEPMLRPDFCEIWEGIYKQGFMMTLYTNATLVTDKIMDTLKKYPPHIIGITVYGSNNEVYKKVCGNGNAFQKTINGIRRLSELPSQIKFRSTVIKDNYDDINNIEVLLKKEFGLEQPLQQPRSLFPPVRGGKSEAREVRLDPKDNVKLFFRRGYEAIEEIVGRDKFSPNNIRIQMKTDNKAHEYRKKYTLLGCDAGMSSYAISWDGKLLGCQVLDKFFINAKEMGFSKAWERFPFQIKLPPLNDKCSRCDIAQHCESCYASRYAETGDLCGCPEYQCQDAHEIMRLIEEE